jgi:hypothetical protein
MKVGVSDRGDRAPAPPAPVGCGDGRPEKEDSLFVRLKITRGSHHPSLSVNVLPD